MRWPLSAKLSLLALSAIAAASLSLNARLLWLEGQRPTVFEPPDILELVGQQFPTEYAAPNNPDDLLLVMVLDRSKTVTQKGITRERPGVDLLTSIRSVAPGTELGPRGTIGSMCFPAEPNKHGKFCVGWAVT